MEARRALAQLPSCSSSSSSWGWRVAPARHQASGPERQQLPGSVNGEAKGRERTGPQTCVTAVNLQLQGSCRRRKQHPLSWPATARSSWLCTSGRMTSSCASMRSSQHQLPSPDCLWRPKTSNDNVARPLVGVKKQRLGAAVRRCCCASSSRRLVLSGGRAPSAQGRDGRGGRGGAGGGGAGASGARGGQAAGGCGAARGRAALARARRAQRRRRRCAPAGCAPKSPEVPHAKTLRSPPQNPKIPHGMSACAAQLGNSLMASLSVPSARCAARACERFKLLGLCFGMRRRGKWQVVMSRLVMAVTWGGHCICA